MSKSILVTGANGFVGHALCEELQKRKVCAPEALKRAVRSASSGMDGQQCSQTAVVGDIGAHTDWRSALAGAETVIHLAGRAHVVQEYLADPLAEFRRVNVDATLNLARQAVDGGVRRFIFISSVKVNGEDTPPGRSYTADDVPAPIDPYGISKYEAENGLHQLAQQSRLEVVIIRPVLVYGPGVKANFLSMIQALLNGVPLPLGAIDNRRSMVALDNLVDLVVTCVNHPAAINRTFLVSDGEDLSTPQLLRRLAAELGVPARVFPAPAVLLKVGATLLGKQNMLRRLCGSLQVDITKTRDLLGWSPPVSVDEGLRRAAQGFLSAAGNKTVD